MKNSMGSLRVAYDNALCESFFATLRCELLDRRRFRTRREARMAVFDFIEGCYNPRRRHSALGYQSPVDFENGRLPAALNPQCRTVHVNGTTPVRIHEATALSRAEDEERDPTCAVDQAEPEPIRPYEMDQTRSWP